jgi:hypothetical protein
LFVWFDREVRRIELRWKTDEKKQRNKEKELYSCFLGISEWKKWLNDLTIM